MPDVINFYSTRGEHGCFSNFSRHEVKLDGKTWPTSEHYFQAQKFAPAHPQLVEKVRKAKGPGESARMGRDRSNPLRKNWESIKDDVMRRVVLAKFKQHERLREILLATGDAKLVEHTDRDSYWGDGGNGSGKNMLGRILMEVREQLKTEGHDNQRYQGEAIKVGDYTLRPTGPKNYTWEKDGSEITIQDEGEHWIWWVKIPVTQVHPSQTDGYCNGEAERSRGTHLKKPDHAIKEAVATMRKLKEGEA